MNTKYIDYLKNLNIPEIDILIYQFESNNITFADFQNCMIAHGAYTIQELLRK